MYSDVVWSINIMLGILLSSVGYVIYWIFKYDDWNPNPYISKHSPESMDSGDEGSGIRTE